MDNACRLFLDAIGAALKNEKVTWDQEIPQEDWVKLFEFASIHRMLPMVYQTVVNCPAMQQSDRSLFSHFRMVAIQMVAIQTQKTAEFLPLIAELRKEGIEPLVVKGIICRRLYPNPDLRMSSDEDVLIPPDQFAACHEVMTRLGMVPESDDFEDYEIPYSRPGGALYVELHKSLFPDESEAYGHFNRFFQDIRSRMVEVDGIPTMAPTDHMLYLLCHAFKHFLHSGFGIRQVCDLILFANRFGAEIDWLYVLEHCRMIRAEQFVAGLFRIGWKYLGFSLEQSRYPIQWQAIYVNEEPLLMDILMSGVYGAASMSRLHSSNITLSAVSAQQKGRRNPNSILKSLFPPAKDLENRYPYLRKSPILLPVAWTNRIIKFGRESSDLPDSTAGDSLRIGSERIELLRKYGVLDKK